jgi:adenosine kinase
MNSILISGSLAYDRIMNFPGTFRDHFHAEKMHALSVSFVVDTLEESFGGTAGNIAYNFTLLGEKPTLIANGGGDFAKYRDYLHKVGVDTSRLQLELTVPTAVGHMFTDQEDNQIAAFYAGAMGRPYTQEIPKADIGIVAAGNGLDMSEMPKKFRANGTPFFFDIGQAITHFTGDAMREAIPGAVAILGNDYEIGTILKKTRWSMQEMLEQVSVVVTTLGAKGSQVHTRENEFTVRPVKAIQVLDPTGAGDAYRAGFAAAWLRKLSIEVCTQVASAVAVYAVESYGTQRHTFKMDEIKKRYAETYGTEFPF